MEGLSSLLQEWTDPEVLAPFIANWGGRIVAAILIFIVGRWIVNLLTRLVVQAIGKANVEETLTRFLGSLIRITLLVFVVLAAVGALGVETTSFLAILGAAGLAIGLALKDSLSNFSSGVMLVFFRPFKAGDFIEAAGIAGVVHSVRIFNTVMKTGDNRVITVPNSLIYAGTITNFSAEPTRRIDMTIGIGYGDDIPRAKELIMDVVTGDERVLKDPAPAILLMELADSSVNFAVRPWVASGDYWATRSDLLERIKAALEDNGLSIPYPQRDLHIVSQPVSSA